MVNIVDRVAVGGNLTPQSVLAAYYLGVFPWFPHDGTDVMWWSPNPRFVIDLKIEPNEATGLHYGRTLKRALRKFHFTMDEQFDQVIQECANKRYEPKTEKHIDRRGTWITPKMQKVYRQLHRRGYAHSIEVWYGDKLVGGLYGVSLGRTFYGESMFSHEANSSKAAVVALALKLREWGFDLIDCMMESSVTKYLGGRYIRKAEFEFRLLRGIVSRPLQPTKWSMDDASLSE